VQPIFAPAVEYGGFWRRFGALFIDGLLSMPLVALNMYWGATVRGLVASWIAAIAVTVLLHVVCLKKYGGSPGKLLWNLRVRSVDLSPITWKQAWLRSGPSLLLAVAGILAMIAAMRVVDPAVLRAATMIERGQLLLAVAPWWQRPLNWISNIWNWGELIVLLTNDERRALHDFLAGTVVIVEPGSSTVQEAPSH
jgi:uncharacterized RDD family membrane protein YckC